MLTVAAGENTVGIRNGARWSAAERKRTVNLPLCSLARSSNAPIQQQWKQVRSRCTSVSASQTRAGGGGGLDQLVPDGAKAGVGLAGVELDDDELGFGLDAHSESPVSASRPPKSPSTRSASSRREMGPGGTDQATTATSDMDAQMRNKYGPLYDEQIELEQEAVERCVQRYAEELKHLVDLGRAAELGTNSQLLLKWYQPLVKLIEEEIFIKYGAMEPNTTTATGATQTPPAAPTEMPEYVPYLLTLTPEKLAVITVHDVLGVVLKSRSGAGVRALVSAIGEAVQTEANFHKLRLHKEHQMTVGKSSPTSTTAVNSSPDAVTATATDAVSASASTTDATAGTSGDVGSEHHSSQPASSSTDVAASSDTTMPTADTSDATGSDQQQPQKKVWKGRARQLVRRDLIATKGIVSRRTINAHAMRLQLMQPFWSSKIKMQIGAALVDLLLRVAKFTIAQPNGVREEVFALQHTFAESASQRYHTRKVVRLHPTVFDQVDVSMLMRDAMHVRYYPMLVPPLPWSAPERGGYYKNNTPIIRYHSYVEQVRALIERQEELGIVYSALNVLGATAWRVNSHVYSVARQIWEDGGGLAEIPDRRDLPIPLPLVPQGEGRSTSWYRQMKAIDRHNSNLHSLRCDFMLKLDVADRFKDRVIYFPHNMDFRGRVYPIPPHLNHMGGDFNRGMLLFANGKPLGERGLYWLKIHLANLCGKDKIPFEDRIAFVDQHLAEVADSATKPLEGNRWWLHTDDPFQCLAVCVELHQALQHPDPRQFISHLPIHQDGTCNGLQHYAALGGDAAGARSVNLLPSLRPQDVYSDVAALVQARIAHDAQLGVPMAQLLSGRVDRKIIKQTVMTSVYGVTFIGARQQINNALKDRGIIPEEQMYEASIYIAKKTFDSIREMFTGAKSIMEWLAACASLIARKGRLVSWVTPLGLPVVQHYRQPTRTQVVHTALQQITLPQEDGLMPVNKRQQRSAFPPNFVHSLDSSHMLLTALMCESRGVAYASVHDSFWTHACSVDDMNLQLREAFVQLHRRPVLQQLRDDFIRQHPDIKFPPLPVPVEPVAAFASAVAAATTDVSTTTTTSAATAAATAPANFAAKSSSSSRFEISQVRQSPYFFN